MLNRVRSLRVSGSLLVLALGVGVACDDPFAACRPGLDCPGDGNSPGNSGGTSPGGENSGGSHSGGGKSGGAGNVGGNTPAGGAHTGGVATSGGMGGEAAGGAPPKPCDGKCKGETPFCDEGDKEGTEDDKCVACLKQTDCKKPTMPMCFEGACVPCKDDFSCTDTLGLTDAPVCLNGAEDGVTDEVRPDTGECVECGTSSDCDKDICDPDTLTCLTGLKYKAKGACETCQHDLECKDGQLCVEQKFDGQTVGAFCTWTKEGLVGAAGSCSAGGKAFVVSEVLTSVNGVDEVFCTLRTTSCVAYKQFGTPAPGCDAETSLADAVCGAPGVNDGLCRSNTENLFLCTYPCAGPEDCPFGNCPDAPQGYCAFEMP